MAAAAATAASRPSASYDYTRTTSENHRQEGARLRREFFTSRAGLDCALLGPLKLARAPRLER